jgi:DNA-binding NarL/FixJ family response regulator
LPAAPPRRMRRRNCLHGMDVTAESSATAPAGQAAPRPRPPTAGLHSLTASKLRVVALAAEGVTNRDIPERLFTSR